VQPHLVFLSIQSDDSSYWNQTTWPSAQAANADIYTILLGTNDAKTFNWFPCTGNDGYSNCSWVGGDNCEPWNFQ
jgi:hypothetical protein